ncbi:MAG: hypothetical protein IT319_12360 [Anaerolineae bacterium]|nr:hypothetical protein [Anaerolineae bacterium]
MPAYALVLALLVTLAGGGVTAQGNTPSLPDVTLLGSGQRGFIAYGETVTGAIERSEAGSDVSSISYVGHNGANRVQGDFDVWYFNPAAGDNAVITVTAGDGDLVPTLLIIRDVTPDERIPTVSGMDYNLDGDATAGVCLRSIWGAAPVGIIVFRPDDTEQTGGYTLTLEKAGDEAALTSGSPTAVCKVGTFVSTNGNYRVNIRTGPGLSFRAIGQMQPNGAYLYMNGYDGWSHIQFWSGDQLADGYVKDTFIHITGSLDGE